MTVRIRPGTPASRRLIPGIGAFGPTLLLAPHASGGDGCGDGALGVPAEECDDANTTSGDGCSAECLIEGPLDGTQARCVSAASIPERPRSNNERTIEYVLARGSCP